MALIAHFRPRWNRAFLSLHLFDGFRTSHEVNKIELLNEDDMRAMINMDRVFEHRSRALSPDHPVLRGTAQNPDVFFQIRETATPFLRCLPGNCNKSAMDKLSKLVGRAYRLFEYVGLQMLTASSS